MTTKKYILVRKPDWGLLFMGCFLLVVCFWLAINILFFNNPRPYMTINEIIVASFFGGLICCGFSILGVFLLVYGFIGEEKKIYINEEKT